jgi:hypothetical protein
MKAWPSNLPTQLWNVSSLPFAAKWRTYVDGTQDSSPEEQAVAYDNAALRVNVAVDMFLSDDATNSTGLGPPIEIMIWPWYTPNVLPLGHAESTPDVDTVEISGTNYSLYHGYNIQGQQVYSWLAHQNVTEIDTDYAPLLKYIMNKGYLGGGLYLGQLEFGTEAMNANLQCTFEASDYTLRIIRQGDPDDPNTTTSTSASATAAPSHTRTNPATAAATTTTGSGAATSSGSASGTYVKAEDGGVLFVGLWTSVAILSALSSILAYR